VIEMIADEFLYGVISGADNLNRGSLEPSVDIATINRSGIVDEAQRRRDALERRLADNKLLSMLAASNFTGPLYRRFEDELAAYGMAVLRDLMSSREIFALAAAQGSAIRPSNTEIEELSRNSEAREDLSSMTVALALPQFRRHLTVDYSRLDMGRGDTLASQFISACMSVFPNEFRKRRLAAKRWNNTVLSEAGHPDVVSPDADPSDILSGKVRLGKNCAMSIPERGRLSRSLSMGIP
jgi:hypothetical protein